MKRAKPRADIASSHDAWDDRCMRQDMQLTLNTLTAYHESGHATIGWLVGFVPLSIKMRDKETGRGRAEFASRHCRAVDEAASIAPDIAVALDIIIALAWRAYFERTSTPM